MQFQIEIPAEDVYKELKSDAKNMLDELTHAHNQISGKEISPVEFLDRLIIAPERINHKDILRAVTNGTDAVILQKRTELDSLLAVIV